MTLYRLKASRGATVVSDMDPKTLDELLQPNGGLPFVAWWLREAETQGCDRVQIVTVKEGFPGLTLGGTYEEVLEP